MDFDTVRPIFGGALKQSQVDGINTILLGWQKYGDGNPQRLAYCLATTKHETADTMQPIHERGAVSYFKKYEPGTKIGKVLGNTLKGDGYRFRGRGYVQLTGRANYAKAGKIIGVDLIAKPELALDPDIAVRILIAGASNGWFTGKSLDDYIDNIDETDDEDLREFVMARRVINGQDKAQLIGGYALVFERAIKKEPPVVVSFPPSVSPPPPDIEPAPEQDDGKPEMVINWIAAAVAVALVAGVIAGLIAFGVIK